MTEPYYKHIIGTTARMRDSAIADAHAEYHIRMSRIAKKFFPVGTRVTYRSQFGRSNPHATVVAHMPEHADKRDVVVVRADGSSHARWINVGRLTLLK